MEKEKYTARMITWFVGITIAFVLIMFPVGYFIISYQYVVGNLERETDILAGVITQIISKNPTLWEFEQTRLNQYLQSPMVEKGLEKRRILDNENKTVMERGRVKALFFIVRSSPLMDSGVVVGRIEISRSMRSLLILKGLMFMFIVPIGIGIFFVLRLVPIQAIHKAELAEQKNMQAINQLAQENAIMARIGRIITSTLNIEEVYDRFADEVRKLIPFDRIAITTIDLKQKKSTIAYTVGVEIPGRRVGDTMPLDATTTGEVMRKRCGFIAQTKDPEEIATRFPSLMPLFKTRLLSMIVVPLFSKDEVIGILHLLSLKPEAYAERDLRLAERVGNQIGGAIANADLFARQKRTEEALRESEKKYRQVVENAAEIIYLTDFQGNFTYANAAGLKVMGYSLDELQAFNGLDIILPEHRERVRAIYTQQYLEKQPTSYMEFPFRNKSGEVLWFGQNASLVVEDGKAVGFHIISRDITERKHAEEALKAKTEELTRSNQELAQFAYVASHDLQEPLRMVTSYVQLLAQRYQDKLDQDAKDFIQFAADGAIRMHSLINDLLTYSRVNTQSRPFEPTPSEKVLLVALDNLKVLIEEKKAVITHDALPTVMADPSQLGQLFQNLLGNAIKFHGEAPPRVHLSAKPDGNFWTFLVRDNGIGIAPEFAERIFVIFQRLHGRDEYPGTGIGLAICKKIVERHRGRIWVSSGDHVGSTFHFTLPKEGGNAG